MGIFRRGEIWWMSFTYQDRQIRRSTETSDRKLAQRIFEKIKGEIAEGKWFERIPGEDYTFTDLMEKYLSEYSAVSKAPKSHVRDRCMARILSKRFKDVPLLAITAKDISEYKLARRADGVSPRTINYELTLMNHAFKIAIREWEWLKENPVRNVTREKVRNRIERWLTLQEESKLLAAAPEWLQDIIVFAINTGFREGEILRLKWHQIDFDRRTITIAEQKNGEIDTLPLNETTLKVLRRKAAGRSGKTEYVFPSSHSTQLDFRNLIRAFEGAVKKAELPKTRFHDLRHTFATRLAQAGVDLFQLQRLGRWKTVSMVMRYAHHCPESLRAGIEVMDRIGKESGFSTILAQSHKKRASRPLLRLVKC